MSDRAPLQLCHMEGIVDILVGLIVSVILVALAVVLVARVLIKGTRLVVTKLDVM